MVELATGRLILRRWREADRSPLAAMNADACVMRHFPAPLTRAESDSFLDRMEHCWEADGLAHFAVTTQEGEFLGSAGLLRPSFEAHFTPCVEVGWRFARHAWGQGLASEAARAGIDWGFRVHGLDEIVSFTATTNRRSEALMQRLGLHRDPAGDFEHPSLAEGHPLRRHVLYRLSRNDWKAWP